MPTEWVYISFKPVFASKFLNQILASISIDDFANLVGVWSGTINRWGRRKKPFYIRLDILKKIISKLTGKLPEKWTLNFFESNIHAIRGYGRSGILQNPKFPFKEDENLVRIVVHMIGDGYMPPYRGSTRRPAYTNGNSFLRQQFLHCLSKVFGDVSNCTYSYLDNSEKMRSYIAISQWIGYILQHWYPDAKYDEIEGSLPASFFDLPLDLKAVIVRTFGDDDGHVGAHSIRFASGGPTILEQMRRLIVELMEATLPADEFGELVKSVGLVKPCQSWFILDVFRPVFGWYAEYVGFSHPERAARLGFQLECDRVWEERGLDGFDMDFLTLIGLREVGCVASVARQFTLREDFLFEVFQRLRRLGWIERVGKRKFTTYYRTSLGGEAFLERTLTLRWGEEGRVVVSNEWWRRLRGVLLGRFGTAAVVARMAGMPETTVRGYLQGRRQWMHARWVVALAALVGWDKEQVAEGVVVGFPKGLAPRYEQCDFLVKDLAVYHRFSLGEIPFADWLVQRRVEGVREAQLLDAEFAEKLQSAAAIRGRIVELAKGQGGEITLAELKADPVLWGLVANRYGSYVADRMAKLVKQGVFRRVKQGCYRLRGIGG